MTVMTQTDAVTIQVPAEYSYLRVLRLTVSSLAADITFDIEEVEGIEAVVREPEHFGGGDAEAACCGVEVVFDRLGEVR